MAPRRGGGGSYSSSSGGSSRNSTSSSSSSSSFCAYCSVPLELTPDGWTDITSWAYLVVTIINLVVVCLCLAVVVSKPWLNIVTGKKDRSKFRLFITAGLLLFLGLALVITDHILHLVRVTTTRSYWITFIFRKLGFNFADVLIFALVYKCIAAARKDVSSSKTKSFRIIHGLIVVILLLLQAASLAWYIYYIIAFFSGSNRRRSALPSVDVAYAALALVVSIEITSWSVLMSIRKQLYKHSQNLLIPISMLICLCSLVSLIYVVGADYTFGIFGPLSWAYSFISSIASIVVFVCLTQMSRASNKRFRDGDKSKIYDDASVGTTNYTSPSPYASEQSSHIYTGEGYQYNPHVNTTYESSPLQSQPWKPDPVVQEIPAAHRTYGRGPQYAAVPSTDHH